MIELVNTKDIADMLDVTPTTVYRMKMRGELPKPDAKIGSNRFAWKIKTIEQWATRSGRKLGDFR